MKYSVYVLLAFLVACAESGGSKPSSAPAQPSKAGASAQSTAAAPPAKRDKLENSPLVWKPTSSLTGSGAIDLTGLSGVRLQVAKVADGRQNRTLLGENKEKSTARIITTSDDVPAFVTEHMKQIISAAGITVVDSGATHVLQAELKQFYVEEIDTYKGDVRMAVTLSSAAGKPVWQGITSGSASRFGRSYKAENYYEALSDSLIEATNNLLRNPGFHAALASRRRGSASAAPHFHVRKRRDRRAAGPDNAGMLLDPESCYRAFTTHDPRFDGRMFVGVASTGVYCRPVCTARQPLRKNCRFYVSAAAAERDGFRPCLRCRPELAPGNASVDAQARLAQAAASLIEDGLANDGRLDAIAARLGVTDRHLRRVFQAEFGVTPVEYAQTQRLLLAKRLLTDSALPVTQVAFAAGFGSLRRFNALFSARYRVSPYGLAQARADGRGTRTASTSSWPIARRSIGPRCWTSSPRAPSPASNR